MPNEFAEVLARHPLPPADPRALTVLDEFCVGIEEGTRKAVLCRLEPGFTTNQGQEYRIILRPKLSRYDRILIRAYIPVNGLDGSDVILDLYDDESRKCKNEASLREELRNFLEEESTRTTLALLSTMSNYEAHSTGDLMPPVGATLPAGS